MPLRTSDFVYDLPEELIAQEPLRQRDSSRLLHLSLTGGELAHRTFSDLPRLLRRGDRLVLNDTRVRPARLYCRKASGAAIELLFIRHVSDGRWYALARPARRVHPGTVVHVDGDPQVLLRIEDVLDDGTRVVSCAGGGVDDLAEVIDRYGRVPLPPYIRRDARDEDRSTYQTVYARQAGAVAAPTAGLHFTSSLFESLAEAGIERSFLTLHVGVGTFRPVKEEDPSRHRMHEEYYEVPQQTVREISETRGRGGRVVAVGTTVVRALEHCAAATGELRVGAGFTRLMVLPGHRFRTVDGLVTNFHLPGSTLLMLVCALAGREPVLAAYRCAVENRYRFYSYGDAMLIL